MAIVGDVLTAPESGWRRYDDTFTQLKYEGTWMRDTSNTSNFNSTINHVYLGTSGAKVSFIFKGTKIRIIGNTFTNKPTNIRIIIDGVEETFSQYETGAGSHQKINYEKTGLLNKIHSVQIISPTDMTNKSWNIDAIDIDSEGEIREPLNKILLLSSDKTYFVRNSKDLIPTMTSNTSPSGVASASTSYSTTPAWKAFNNSNAPDVGDGNPSGWTNNGGSSGWIQYQFPSKEVVNMYTITPYNLQSDPTLGERRSVKDWTFEGSNDGINFIILDTRTNVTDWVNSTKKKFEFKNYQPYLYYRLRFSSNNGDAYTSIGEMEMMLKGSINTLPSHSEENLVKYGMNSPIQFNEIFTSENHILQDAVSESEDGLWTTQLDRKPLSIKFN